MSLYQHIGALRASIRGISSLRQHASVRYMTYVFSLEPINWAEIVTFKTPSLTTILNRYNV